MSLFRHERETPISSEARTLVRPMPYTRNTASRWASESVEASSIADSSHFVGTALSRARMSLRKASWDAIIRPERERFANGRDAVRRRFRGKKKRPGDDAEPLLTG